MPWVDDEDTQPATPELAVGDWDYCRGLSTSARRWSRWGTGGLAVAGLVAAVITGERWWLLAAAAVPVPGIVAAFTRRTRRRADPRWWQRQIILEPVSIRVDSLLRDYEQAPITQQLARLGFSPTGFRRERRGAGADVPDGELPYPEGTTILDAFDESGQVLVLISEAGLGKTTQLSLLARDLIGRARAAPRGERAVLPFLVDLSSYRGEPFDDWLVKAINREYRLHPAMVRGLLAGTAPDGHAGRDDADGILLLLDGLDEIPGRKHRLACTEHLREFRQRCVGLVVTCRKRDLALARQIEATRYVAIERPSRPVVQRYLDDRGDALADVRAALAADRSLWDLLQSPLWLRIIAQTYAARPATELLRPGATHAKRRDREKLILDAYVERMLGHRRTRYSREKTLTWLTWLARTLRQRGEQTLYLDRLDHTWTTTSTGEVGRSASPLLAAVLGGALAGGAAMLAGEALGLLPRLIVAPIVMFTIAVFAAFKASAGASLYGLQPVEQLRWSWTGDVVRRRAKRDPGGTDQLLGKMGLDDAFMAGMVFIFLFPGGFTLPLFWKLTPMMLIWISAHGYTDTNFVPALRAERNLPNEGIRRSVRHALVSGLILAVLAGAYFMIWLWVLNVPLADVIYLGIVLALTYGLGRAYQLGGSACACYWTIRVRLRRRGHAPLRYQHFLHNAEQRILLRRVGSGFAFPHRRLLEHLDTQPEDLIQRLAARAEAG